MKKIFGTILIALCMLISVNVCHAEHILGEAYFTDVVTYINHIPIYSVNFEGNTLICAEDLNEFGFNVKWNEYKETLTISRNQQTTFDGGYPCIDDEVTPDMFWTKACDVTTTNVRVYTENYQYASFGGIDGFTFINVEDLKCIDGVSISWVPEVRALKVWVEGLEVSPRMRRMYPNFNYYDNYEAPAHWYYYDWFEGSSKEGEPGVVINFFMMTEDDCYVNNDYGKLVIKDVINADGESILKKQIYSESGTQIWPYMDRITEAALAIPVRLMASDIYQTPASEPGGLIKFAYCEYGYSETSEVFTVRVNQLPYINSMPHKM